MWSTLSPIAGPGGDITAMAVIARGITGQQRTEAEFRRSCRYFELSLDRMDSRGTCSQTCRSYSSVY